MLELNCEGPGNKREGGEEKEEKSRKFFLKR